MRFMKLTTGMLLAGAIGTATALAYGLRMASGAPVAHPKPQDRVQLAQGYVFEDLDHDRVRDPGERGIPGVRVSDQNQIVVTGRNGFWSMPIEDDEDTAYFVIKPRGWRTPVLDNQLPVFYYLHKPKGSPASKFAGVSPTGPMPKSIDFPLYPSKEPSKFEALFFGDTQPRNVREVEYIRYDVVEPIVGKTQAKFGVTLGDIVFDDLSVFEPMVNTIALLGIPWYNVIGNHDMNYDAPNDELSDETFERWFGPNYYSFDHGPVHFVVLDNVEWRLNTETKRGAYSGKFGEKQLKWLALDLSLVPKSHLVVFMMHIPLTGTSDRAEFFKLIQDRSYTLSVSAHTHYQEHIFFKDKDGFKGKHEHHHVVNVTACGSWWEGAPDEFGIPHTTMRCGAPNGYAVFRFDGNQYSIDFRAARRRESYQMEIHAPESLEGSIAKGTAIYVNVFGGSERSKVEIRYGSGPWIPMEKVAEPDPAYVKMFERDKDLKTPYIPLPAPINSPHLWKSAINIDPEKGMLPIHVRTKDMFGQTFFATRGVEIR